MSRKTNSMGNSGSTDKAGNTVDHEMKSVPTPLTLEQVRQELKGVKGKRFWRSIDELADTAEFQAAV